MKHRLLRIVLLTLLEQPLSALALSPIQVFDKVKDSILVVKTFDARGIAISQGSGVVMPSNKIATNCHVLENGNAFMVGKEKKYVPAILFAGNESKDICLLDAPGMKGKPAQLGSAMGLKVGEPVFAIGSPMGLELSLTDGIVSQLRGRPIPIIQTTAAISGGSSGGGLFNSQGQLVGLTTLKIKDEQGFNFSIPVEWLSYVKPHVSYAPETPQPDDWERERTNLRASLHLVDTTVTRTAFRNPADEVAWLAEMSRRLAKHMPDEVERLEFLTTLHWEASRAGIDPQLMLGQIEIESGFRKFSISSKGARGYMQVMPYWVEKIGSPEHNLFQLRTNLRYGALILRHYIDIEEGDLFLALGRYNDSRGRPEYPNLVVSAWKRSWDYQPVPRGEDVEKKARNLDNSTPKERREEEVSREQTARDRLKKAEGDECQTSAECAGTLVCAKTTPSFMQCMSSDAALKQYSKFP